MSMSVTAQDIIAALKSATPADRQVVRRWLDIPDGTGSRKLDPKAIRDGEAPDPNGLEAVYAMNGRETEPTPAFDRPLD